MSLDVTTTASWANSNIVDDINDDAFTMGIWVYPTGDPSGCVWTTATGILSGHNAYRIILSGLPVVFSFMANWGSSGGWLATPTLPLNAWSHLGVIYDKGSNANVPVFYINGVLVASSEDRAPTGAFPSDPVNSVAFGSGQGRLAQLDNCLIAEAAWFNVNDFTAGEMAYMPYAVWRLRPSNLKAYWPMLSDERNAAAYTASERIQGARLSVEDSTATWRHPPVRPFSVLPWGRSHPFVGRTRSAGPLIDRKSRLTSLGGRLVA